MAFSGSENFLLQPCYNLSISTVNFWKFSRINLIVPARNSQWSTIQGLTPPTVTVDGAYEVWRVPRLLSTPKVASVTSEHISIENKIEPREILEKIEFYWANPKNCYFSLLWCALFMFLSLLTVPNGLRSDARWVFQGRIQRGTIFILWFMPKNCLD